MQVSGGLVGARAEGHAAVTACQCTALPYHAGRPPGGLAAVSWPCHPPGATFLMACANRSRFLGLLNTATVSHGFHKLRPKLRWVYAAVAAEPVVRSTTCAWALPRAARGSLGEKEGLTRLSTACWQPGGAVGTTGERGVNGSRKGDGRQAAPSAGSTAAHKCCACTAADAGGNGVAGTQRRCSTGCQCRWPERLTNCGGKGVCRRGGGRRVLGAGLSGGASRQPDPGSEEGGYETASQHGPQQLSLRAGTPTWLCMHAIVQTPPVGMPVRCTGTGCWLTTARAGPAGGALSSLPVLRSCKSAARVRRRQAAAAAAMDPPAPAARRAFGNKTGHLLGREDALRRAPRALAAVFPVLKAWLAGPEAYRPHAERYSTE